MERTTENGEPLAVPFTLTLPVLQSSFTSSPAVSPRALTVCAQTACHHRVHGEHPHLSALIRELFTRDKLPHTSDSCLSKQSRENCTAPL